MTHPTPVPMPRPMPAPQAVPVPSPVPMAMPAPATAMAAAPVAAGGGMPVPMPVTQVSPAAAPMAASPLAVAATRLQPQAQPFPQPAPPPMPGNPMPIGVQPAATDIPEHPIGEEFLQAPLPDIALQNMQPEERPEGGEKALPAITIHAFCETQQTAGTINEATQDWRMKRTGVKIYMGGLLAACEFYKDEGTPALVLIECGMRGPELFRQLETLAGVCDENTQVVVIGAANDIRLYRQLMDKGVSDYLVPPFRPLNLIRSLSDLFADPDQPFTGRVAAFFGAKGGVGSSTMAHNVAWQLAESLGQSTALVDLDTSWGTTGLDFHYDNSSGLEDALSNPDRLDETLLDRIMIRHTDNLSILPASGTLGRGVQDKAAFERVVDAVRGVSPLSVLDMPHMWTDWTESILTQADDVVVTAALDLANLRNAKNLVDVLKAARPNDPDPIVILNKVGLSPIKVEEFSAMMGVDPAVTFAFEPEVFVHASNNGEMITDTKTAAGTVEGLRRIAHRLKTGEYPSASAPAGRMGKLSVPKLGGRKAPKEHKPGDDVDGKAESRSFIKNLLKKG